MHMRLRGNSKFDSSLRQLRLPLLLLLLLLLLVDFLPASFQSVFFPSPPLSMSS